MKTEFSRKPRHYILTKSLRRKNARRRVVDRFHTKQACIDWIQQHYSNIYYYDIYTYDWKLIERVDILKNLRKERKDEAED